MMAGNDMDTPPRIDLHRHLDGNIRVRTVLELAQQHHIPLPAKDEESLRPYLTITERKPGLLEFLAKLDESTAVLADLEACRRVAFENMEDAAREKLDYVELRFSPYFMSRAFHLDLAGVVEAVVQGVAEGREKFGVKAGLIGILSRTYGPDMCAREVEALLASSNHLVAIDLAGDEIHFPPELFVSHFNLVRSSGLPVTIHAGEAAGPESIRGAMDLLGATRIGHGIRAAESPELMEDMLRRGIGVECCLTSNLQTSMAESYASHPLKRFLEFGLLATINTDDPGISGIDYDHELKIAAPAAGLTPQLIKQAQWNAQKIAFAI